MVSSGCGVEMVSKAQIIYHSSLSQPVMRGKRQVVRRAARLQQLARRRRALVMVSRAVLVASVGAWAVSRRPRVQGTGGISYIWGEAPFSAEGGAAPRREPAPYFFLLGGAALCVCVCV